MPPHLFYSAKKQKLGYALLLLFLAALPLTAFGASPAGIVIGWGDNVSGQATGVPSSGYSTGVVKIAGQALTNATAVAAGMNHSLAIRKDGTVVGWGNNGRGQATGVPSEYPGRAAGVVKIEGQILSNVVAIAAGWIHSHALLSNGTIVAWGTEMDGRKIRVPAKLSNVRSIAGWYSLAARTDGTVIGWGGGNEKLISGLSNVLAISAPRADHGPLVVLLTTGDVVESSFGNSPLLTVVMSNATAISAGRWQNLAVNTDGTVLAWGSDNSVPSGLTNVVAVAAGDSHSLALKEDGTVVAWGRIGLQPATVPVGLSNVVAIAAGNGFSLAITTNSTVAERFSRSAKVHE